ncbi:hypothetical protein M569_12953, partial [Genlisea aurea]
NLTDPELVVRHVQSEINASVVRRRQLLLAGARDQSQCLTGNPIDDCWRCGPYSGDRQRMADCAIGFGRLAAGGKNGRIYTVTDASDGDPINPAPGTLRYGVIQYEPLWIIFESSMSIDLKHELIFNSFKTVDARGFDVRITGYGCIVLHHVSHVIIHNVRIHDCRPAPPASIRLSPDRVEDRGGSDGDGITIMTSRDVWIDHCGLSNCADGLIDATLASTAITISNNHFSHHDKVMLLGHDDRYYLDSGMQVTIAFNHFGDGLVQRMPRCRWGYVHVVNNDFTAWQMYAIGGSASPTINSQGNRYTAPADPNAKEVTKRVDASESEWLAWNWRTVGDKMVNGAFFVPSGDRLSQQYAEASSLDPMSADLVAQLTLNAGP